MAFCQRHSLDVGFVDQRLIWSLHCASCSSTPILLRLLISFHEVMIASNQFDGNPTESFKVKSAFKQDCIPISILFGIYFAAHLQQAFDGSGDGDCPKKQV